ncbi:MAG: EVE domain-containing protein [Gammaproteobacteria bacterium]|nr:MAG: EVE domain-containing protein [Gammaproteobacteria bacterium]
MNYWLFKSEPDVYGIDHLAAEPGQQCRWDGIRNYQARNHLRDTVAVGDQVLFYHSSCPRPGVAGIMEVVKAAYPDPSQFDMENDYYDPKATQEKPRWFAVDVKLVKKFAQLLPLSELKAQPQLEEMALFKQGRLSIVPLTEKEWRTIRSLAD